MSNPPRWRTTLFRSSAIAFSIHSQLPSRPGGLHLYPQGGTCCVLVARDILNKDLEFHNDLIKIHLGNEESVNSYQNSFHYVTLGVCVCIYVNSVRLRNKSTFFYVRFSGTPQTGTQHNR
jgi:hypothetical protein